MTHLTGRCLCGAVRFEADGPALWCAHCHCESCRRHTSAPVATYVGYPRDRVRFRPEPRFFESSPGVERACCDRCGSPLAYRAERWPDEIHLFWSSFDEPGRHRPTRHVLFDERLAGFDVYDDLPRYATGSRVPVAWGAQPALRVLFLCTGNSARSILAEALLNARDARVADQRVIGHSAGSRPGARPRPEALALLRARGIATHGLRSKSWDEFTTAGAPPFRLVVTLCDDAAAEPCPVFPGGAERRHWGLPDPAAGAATYEATAAALERHLDGLLEELAAGQAVTSPSAPR